MNRLSKAISSERMSSAPRSQDTISLTPVSGLLQSSRKSISNKLQESRKALSENMVLPDSIESSESFSMFGFGSPLFWILLVILLAILGFNIFKYLAEGTELFASIMHPITSMFASITGDTTKTAASTVSTGGKKIIETTADTTQSTIDYATKGLVGGIDVLQDKLKSFSVVEPENENSMSETVTPNNGKAKQNI